MWPPSTVDGTPIVLTQDPQRSLENLIHESCYHAMILHGKNGMNSIKHKLHISVS